MRRISGQYARHGAAMFRGVRVGRSSRHPGSRALGDICHSANNRRSAAHQNWRKEQPAQRRAEGVGEEMGIVGECRAWVFVMAAGVVWSTLRPWTRKGWLAGLGEAAVILAALRSSMARLRSPKLAEPAPNPPARCPCTAPADPLPPARADLDHAMTAKINALRDGGAAGEQRTSLI